MAQLPLLEDILKDPGLERAVLSDRYTGELLQHADEEKRVMGYILRACALFDQKREKDALDSLLEAHNDLEVIPLPIMANVIWLCERLGEEQLAAHECMEFAEYAGRMGYDDLVLESGSAAAILDTLGGFEIIRSPALSHRLAMLYEGVAKRHESFSGGVACPPPRKQDERLNVALLLPNLVDYIVAYTQRALHFARFLDEDRYRLFVYSTEIFTARPAPMFPFGAKSYVTGEIGRESIKEFEERGVPVYLAPKDISFTDAARNVACKLAENSIDILISQGGLATSIDWLALRLSRVPVRAAIHIGSSMMTPGLDVTFFDTHGNAEKEDDVWPEDAGDKVVVPRSVDIDKLRSQPTLEKSRFGLPDDSVVIGTVSNVLNKRLTPEYMDIICEALQRHPRAWFVPFGSEPIEEKMEYFRSRGVADRVRFGGRQSFVASALSVIDIYANEFPVGGSQSVREAMLCGVPVVAMHWSNAHAECVGASVVGPEYAIPGRDPAAYLALLEEWIDDPAARTAAGSALKQRAEQMFSARNYVATILDHVAGIYRMKVSSNR